MKVRDELSEFSLVIAALPVSWDEAADLVRLKCFLKVTKSAAVTMNVRDSAEAAAAAAEFRESLRGSTRDVA